MQSQYIKFKYIYPKKNSAQQGLGFNSLAPGKFEWNFLYVIFKRILVIDGWGICYEIALIWMSLDFTDDQSTLVQVMAWCHQATSHYLNQCWPRYMSPYGVTRPQWVKHRIYWSVHLITSSHVFGWIPSGSSAGFVRGRNQWGIFLMERDES